ncbi:hypothetical protein POM88_004018 [Heracleum sosnowskyi]|uniref:Uncharacterized protein n=1 Tax=Heracleum sosnowskyi TaxID=360622 RepID=A0AAD8JJN0_9APIA|nr:hypothetical protein POM88_004018 [Heracleum sosnowskyi]
MARMQLMLMMKVALLLIFSKTRRVWSYSNCHRESWLLWQSCYWNGFELSSFDWVWFKVVHGIITELVSQGELLRSRVEVFVQDHVSNFRSSDGWFGGKECTLVYWISLMEVGLVLAEMGSRGLRIGHAEKLTMQMALGTVVKVKPDEDGDMSFMSCSVCP